LRQDGDRIDGDFVVSAGESRAFVLTYSPSHRPLPARVEAPRALAETVLFWEDWVRRGRRPQRWEAQVVRSLITLRALIYTPTGGIVAAPTSSLPEFAGGSRNWDYRFCWLRDATLSLLALMDAGYIDEAAAWRDWLLRAVAGRADQIQIMYGIAGERHLPERDVGWLEGFAGSRPVRVGNAAHGQRQLDVFGEVMDVLHQARAQGIGPLESAWTLQRSLLDFLAGIWEQPDHGIWETRGPMRHWTYSKIMCWLAFDRAIQDAERYSLDGPVDQWRSMRERIHHDVCTKGFDARRNSFVQWYGSDQVDASLLQIPTLGFLEPTEPRVLGTIAAIEQDLLRDGLVRRYDTDATDDGLPPGEGAFLACSFWLADAYVQCGRQEDAERLFEHLQGLCNDVGLLSEQYDPRAGRMLGNFPQAFSHLSLIATAFNLSEGARPAAQRSGQQAGPLPQARSRGVPAGRPPSDSGGNAGRARFSRRS
jgi:GH15 family glucan-1,4-alpha-glucosidase